MSSVGSLTRYVHELRSPDQRQRDEAARIIWERFCPRLKILVRRHLDSRISGAKTNTTFSRACSPASTRASAGQDDARQPAEELWKLLVRITMCKVVNTAHRHMADRRDIRRERSDGLATPTTAAVPTGCETSRPVPAHAAGPDGRGRGGGAVAQPAPPDELRQIVLWKLEGFTNAEISPMIGKTVRRSS